MDYRRSRGRDKRHHAITWLEFAKREGAHCRAIKAEIKREIAALTKRVDAIAPPDFT